MKIEIRFFAILKDKAGVSRIQIEMLEGQAVRDGVDVVVGQYPMLGPFIAKIAFAVNQEYASIDTVLHEGDELAFIPPVSGG